MKYFKAIILFCFCFKIAAAQQLPAFINPQSERYADSVIKKLSPAQRIGQLFMLAAYSKKDSVHINEMDSIISNYGIGGLIFFQGGPVSQALLTNHYQSISKVPLLIGIDGEWGLAMRLDSTIRFPRQMTLSAMNDGLLIYKMGDEIAKQCKRLGIHINFAPDADVNNNILNPIIGSRSFGDDVKTVSNYSWFYMKGLQQNHILATGKHFPGHGNTDADSHLTLPVVVSDSAQLDSVEFVPFRKLISEGLGGMMVAHLSVPALDTIPDHPSTLSKKIVTGLLKEQMGFKGLIFTDALNMKGVSACYVPGLLDKLALLAGNDVLLYSENVKTALEEIHFAVENCEITQEEIDGRVKKILMVKHWVGLNNYRLVDTTNLFSDLNSSSAISLQQKMYRNSITLLQNKNSLIPFRNLDTLRIASVALGNGNENLFQEQLKKYADVKCFQVAKDATEKDFREVKKSLSGFNCVVISLHNSIMNAAKKFNISDEAQRFVDEMTLKNKIVFVDFGNAYTLTRFSNLEKARAVVLAYEDMSVTQNLVAQLLFGGVSSSGKIPILSTEKFPKHSGMITDTIFRFGYSLPEDVGMNSSTLNKIDSIAKNAIAAHAMPGCQVLVAKDERIIYQKSFGAHTYEDTTSVSNSDLYDIASVTKISATALAVMKLFDEKKIELDKPLSKYLPALKNTNKKSLTLREVMAHQAGLQAWIPFWKKTLSNDSLDTTIYHKAFDKKYSLEVADSLYMRNDFADSIMQWIYDSPLGARGKYVYSDLGPILMKSLVEKISGKPLDVYLEKYFYKPLGLTRLTFNPKNKFELKEIVPTEVDTNFRRQLIHGNVHDPAAAMLGGVSGNAGVFSNANNLAVIMQMLLNGGTYGGKRYLSENTVSLFTRQQFPQDKNRRGLFFDKPEPDSSKASPVCKIASLKTFGHQGFTGTCAWVDPEYNLVYIFLSNRVYPDASNEKLVKLNVRTSIQQVIYDSLKK